MGDAVCEITGREKVKFFLFIDQETLAATDPLQASWTTGKSQTVKLAE
jgi:hypothetical protein